MNLRTATYTALFYGLMNLFGSPNTALADSQSFFDAMPTSRKIKTIEIESKLSLEDRVKGNVLFEFLSNECSARHLQMLLDGRKEECGGLITTKGNKAFLYVFDDPSDDYLREGMRRLYDRDFSRLSAIKEAVLMRHQAYVEEMKACGLIDAHGEAMVQFGQTWLQRFDELKVLGTVIDMTASEPQNTSLRKLYQSRLNQYLPDLKKELIDHMFYSNLRVHEIFMRLLGEKIIGSWHSHPEELQPSQIDLRISKESEPNRFHAVVSEVDIMTDVEKSKCMQGLHGWLYIHGNNVEDRKFMLPQLPPPKHISGGKR